MPTHLQASIRSVPDGAVALLAELRDKNYVWHL